MGAQTPTDPKTHVAETRMASEPLNQGQENGTSQKSQSKTPIYYNSQPSHSSPIIYARAKRVGVWASTSRALGSGLPCFFRGVWAPMFFWGGLGSLFPIRGKGAVPVGSPKGGAGVESKGGLLPPGGFANSGLHTQFC